MPIPELENRYIGKIPDLSWYLIRTMPRSEQRAEIFFKLNNIPCYLPRYNRSYVNSFVGRNGKQYNYKRPPVMIPMFPGYIFAALDISSMSNARRDKNIAQVCLYKNYTEEELLADLWKVQDFEFLALNNKVEIRQDIQEGKKVIIERGAFKGWIGVVEKRLNQNYIFIRIDSVGASLGVNCAAIDCDVIDDN